MLTFSKEFFKGEELSGFYVEPLVKHMWAAKLELLAKFDEVCKKHDITYYADWGTLLGAVRHKGFIPWDDDIDVCLKRPDFEKFSQIAPEEFLIFDDNLSTDPVSMVGKYLFSDIHTAKVHTHIQTTILSTTQTLFFDQKYLEMYHGYPIGIGMDIFPLDFLPDQSETTDKVFDTITMIEKVQYNNVHWDSNGFPVSNEATDYIKNIEKICNVELDWNNPVRIQLLRLMDSLYSLFSEEESTQIVPMYWQSSFPERNLFHKKEWFDEIVYLPFENMMLPAPKEYDKVLTVLYGDYMKPVIFENNHVQRNLDQLLSSLPMDKEAALNTIKKLITLYE